MPFFTIQEAINENMSNKKNVQAVFCGHFPACLKVMLPWIYTITAMGKHEWKAAAEIFTEIFFSYRREYGTIEPKGCGYNENNTAPPAPIVYEGTKLVCLH